MMQYKVYLTDGTLYFCNLKPRVKYALDIPFITFIPTNGANPRARHSVPLSRVDSVVEKYDWSRR